MPGGINQGALARLLALTAARTQSDPARMNGALFGVSKNRAPEGGFRGFFLFGFVAQLYRFGFAWGLTLRPLGVLGANGHFLFRCTTANKKRPALMDQPFYWLRGPDLPASPLPVALLCRAWSEQPVRITDPTYP